MYTVCVRDHFMIAHSFNGDVFGPAQKLHGATYVVDAAFNRTDVDADGIVVDIGKAAAALSAVLGEINYQNLDDNADFAGKNTTTEFLARSIFDRLSRRILAGELGEGAKAISSMRVVLNESHIAWAAYEGSIKAVK